MAGSGTMKMAFVVLVSVAMVVAPRRTEAITCGQVVSSLTPCLNYLKTGGMVPAACCNGVRSLNSAATTPTDRKTVCGCLKSAAASTPGINLGLANSLPGKCGVNIPYKISPSTDCSKVQ